MFRVNARVPVVLCVRDAYTQEGEREREREARGREATESNASL